MSEREFFDQVCEFIPWGTQTNVKRPKPFIEETIPYFITHAIGSRMFNTEGKEYIDFLINSESI